MSIEHRNSFGSQIDARPVRVSSHQAVPTISNAWLTPTMRTP